MTDTGCHSVRETPDHIDVLGKTRSGAVFTADISGGVAPEDAPRLRSEVALAIARKRAPELSFVPVLLEGGNYE